MDKRVPVAIIVLIAIQGAVGISMVNKMSFDIAQNHKDVIKLQQETDRQDLRLNAVIRVQVAIEGISKQLTKMDVEYRASIRRLWDETRKKKDK